MPRNSFNASIIVQKMGLLPPQNKPN
jgi:hypothetical protein